MLRIFAVLFGIAFIFAGIAGMLPSFTPDGLLFGWFQVDSTHNVFHIVSGVFAIMAATSYRLTKFYFLAIGLIYAVLAVGGFLQGGDLGFIHMQVNMADNVLHACIALVALYACFGTHREAP
ncbi:MAG: hypothetical protein A3E85_05525 [Gammaproteobacteria bacterium RIFCSPHIGHO2_12_FULL_45_12]|nr:MAG: hypothetical protein A3E85_05525 [Gammaproteobacteria bacterium RIFCSPHIGHO2_12_FULL_45_12]